MNCDPDEFGWCPTHDVPFIDIVGQNICAFAIGQTTDMIADHRETRIYVKMRSLESTCTNEHHGWDDCDHSDCYDSDDVEWAVKREKKAWVENKEVGDLLDLIEQGRLMPADISEWRRRTGTEDTITQRFE
jgi:hypothetical protein